MSLGIKDIFQDSAALHSVSSVFIMICLVKKALAVFITISHVYALLCSYTTGDEKAPAVFITKKTKRPLRVHNEKVKKAPAVFITKKTKRPFPAVFI